MGAIIRNIEHETPLILADELSYQIGQIVSKTLTQNKHRSLTLFAFDKDEEISTHESSGDAMIVMLDGKARVTIDGIQHVLNAGETIVMPAKKPHAVYGEDKFKMLLIVIFSEEVQ